MLLCLRSKKKLKLLRSKSLQMHPSQMVFLNHFPIVKWAWSSSVRRMNQKMMLIGKRPLLEVSVDNHVMEIISNPIGRHAGAIISMHVCLVYILWIPQSQLSSFCDIHMWISWYIFGIHGDGELGVIVLVGLRGNKALVKCNLVSTGRHYFGF